MQQPARTRWLVAPAVAVYAVVTSALFAAFGPQWGPSVADPPQWWWDLFAYQAPDLIHRPGITLLHFVTSVWANVHWLQYLYVTGLVVVFGTWFERMEGTGRTVAVFYTTSIIAGIIAGSALLALDAWVGGPFWEREVERVWVGGSAGAYGILGAIAARARRPGPLLALFAAWEVGLAVVYLHRATPLFHVTALAAGFVMLRWWPFPSRAA